MYLINKRTRIDAKGAKICLPLKKTRNILYEFKLRRVIIAKFYSHPHAAIFRFSDICLLSYQQDRRPLGQWSHK